MLNKKGMQLWDIITYGLIALVIAVILIVLAGNKIGNFGRSTGCGGVTTLAGEQFQTYCAESCPGQEAGQTGTAAMFGSGCPRGYICCRGTAQITGAADLNSAIDISYANIDPKLSNNKDNPSILPYISLAFSVRSAGSIKKCAVEAGCRPEAGYKGDYHIIKEATYESGCRDILINKDDIQSTDIYCGIGAVGYGPDGMEIARENRFFTISRPEKENAVS